MTSKDIIKRVLEILRDIDLDMALNVITELDVDCIISELKE